MILVALADGIQATFPEYREEGHEADGPRRHLAPPPARVAEDKEEPAAALSAGWSASAGSKSCVHPLVREPACAVCAHSHTLLSALYGRSWSCPCEALVF